MIDSFEDGDLSFEVLEQLGGHLVALDDLDSDRFPSRLQGYKRSIQGSVIMLLSEAVTRLNRG